MSFTSAPPPTKDPIADAARKITAPWLEYLTSLTQTLDRSPSRAETVTRTGLTASIGTTPIPSAALSSGLYRISVYGRITRAATTSSSLTVTISWTEDGISLSESYSAVTGNTTTTVLTGPPKLLKIDANSPVSYSTTYASVGGTTMIYELSIVLERVDA